MSSTFSLAGLYADSVIKEERTFAQIPKVMKPKVKEIAQIAAGMIATLATLWASGKL